MERSLIVPNRIRLMMRVVAVTIVCTFAVPAILFAQRPGFVQPFVEIEDVEVKPLAFEQTKGAKLFDRVEGRCREVLRRSIA